MTSVLLVSLTVLVWRMGSFCLPEQTASFGDFCLRGYSRHREAGASGGRRATGGEGLPCTGTPAAMASLLHVCLPRTPNANTDRLSPQTRGFQKKDTLGFKNVSK